MVFNPVVRLVQTVHYVKISTISKQTETSVHLCLNTKEYHRVRQKHFMGPWYVWHKPCTNLVSRLALSPNRPNRASIWSSSPRSTNGCIQNDFLSLWYVLRKPYTYLSPILTLSPNGQKQDSTWPTWPRGSVGCVQNDFLAYGTFGVNHGPILRQDYHYLEMYRNERPLEPRHLGIPSGASK
jgi:hypothetical protein